MLNPCRTLLILPLWLLAAFICRADFQGATHLTPFEEIPIAYSKAKAAGPVAKLQERLDKGEVALKRDEQFGYLISLLEHLHARKSSQMLVFSKTSFQRERIDPQHPRAILEILAQTKHDLPDTWKRAAAQVTSR